MNLYVIRHGQTDWNINNLLQGSSDIELNSNGIEEAKKVSTMLKNNDFNIIYSSPLKRAFDTATYVNRYHNKDIFIDSRLIERNFGDFEGTNLLKNMKNYWNYNLNLNDNNVENIQLFFHRVYSFC